MATKGSTSGFDTFRKGAGNAAKAAATVATTGADMTTNMGKTAGKVATKTASGSAGLVGNLLNMVAGFASKHPKITFLVTVYAGVKAIQHWRNKRQQPPMMQDGQMPQQAMPQPYDTRGQHPAQDVSQAASQLSPEQMAFLKDMQQQAAAAQASGAPAPAPMGQDAWKEQLENRKSPSRDMPGIQ